MNARPIDHLVLPVRDLSAARGRLSRLGFTVAADAVHPFGTGNACVFLPDGSYLEPLAVLNRRHAGTAAKRGNVFTAHDLAFRNAKKREGFSSLVVATRDADADHARYRMHGISAGDVLEFARAMKLPDETEVEARFRLAFAGEVQPSDFLLFSCQRLNALPSDRPALETHANMVTGLSEIVLSAAEPSVVTPLLQQVLMMSPDGDAAAVVFNAPNGRVRIVRPEDAEAEFSLANGSGSPGLSGRAVIFRTADLAVTEITLAANDVAFVRREGRVLVQPAPGQGVLFGFEE